MMRRKHKIVFAVFLIVVAISLSGTDGLSDQFNTAVSAVAVAERSSVFIQEPFLFQIQISGTENPENPDMTIIDGASVIFRGGQQNSSSSVSIINGKMTRIVRKGYVFSYQITPQKTGQLTIPPIKINADSQTVLTNTVAINVKKPEKTNDFKLRLSISKNDCYVGESVILTVTWYLAKDVRNFDFSLPFLENDDFYLADPEAGTGKTYIKIPLKSGEVQAKRGRGSLDGEPYTTISFKKVLIPKHDGNIKIGPAIVVCEALEGYRKRESPFGNQFGDDFFSDFFNRGSQGIYRKKVVESNALSLQVSDVPEEGRPENFVGHIGKYRIYAQASPTEINVGDPITLKIALSGPVYLDYVKLPPLREQKALSRDFKIPDERAAGEMVGDAKKVFTQTIRALRQGINKIPAINLPYFDTETGQYNIAKTEPIPIKVRATKIVTALDAEGNGTSIFSGSELKTWESGIRHNYESPDIIEHQYYGPFSKLKHPMWLIMTACPPVIYIALFLFITIRKRRSRNLDVVKAGKAYGRLKKKFKNAGNLKDDVYDIVLYGLRSYLEDRLKMPHKVHTFSDVDEHLAAAGVGQDTLSKLKTLFTKCEQGRYAGNGAENSKDLPSEALNFAQLIEKILK